MQMSSWQARQSTGPLANGVQFRVSTESLRERRLEILAGSWVLWRKSWASFQGHWGAIVSL